MGIRITKHLNKSATPQTQPVSGKNQVKNNAGGYVFEISNWDRLSRWLILGSEKGTYYVSEKKLTVENVECVSKCIANDGERVVRTILEISESGRAAKNEPALYALALCTYEGDLKTKKAAYEAIPRVARTGTHLFQFVQYVNSMRGWGRALRRAIGNWYVNMPLEKLAYQVVKYPQRVTEEGDAKSRWSHRDVLRKAHPSTKDKYRKMLFDYVCDRTDSVKTSAKDLKILVGAEKMKSATSKKQVISLIEEYNLPHEVIPKDFANDPDVWRTLLPNMPLTATLRTLGRLSNYGVLSHGSEEVKNVVSKLQDEEYVRKSRIHPLNVLIALKTYKNGRGLKGSLSWTPSTKILDALDEMFYISFGNVEPTNKNIMLALDVSGSMSSSVVLGAENLTAREATACMAMVTARVEKNYEIMGFSNTFMELDISPKQRLDAVCRYMEGLPFRSTDCSLPMQYALQKKMKIDAFCVYTDNETYAGSEHPFQSLQKYRKAHVNDAKLIVVGTSASNFSIADPSDKGSLDISGFDSAAPEIISSFIRGEI